MPFVPAKRTAAVRQRSRDSGREGSEPSVIAIVFEIEAPKAEEYRNANTPELPEPELGVTEALVGGLVVTVHEPLCSRAGVVNPKESIAYM